MNCVVNLGFILGNKIHLETKYYIALSPNSCGILVYKLHTSKVTKTTSLHVFKNSGLYLMLLLTCLIKGFKIRSEKLFNLLVGHFGPPTIGLSCKCSGSKLVISYLF